MHENSSKSLSNLNPFPGLRAFDKSESHLFFGREKHIDDVLSKLKSHHFVAVVGTSGTGKSSLIKAGVLPSIAEGKASKDNEKWEIVSMNPGSSPIKNLAEAICLNPNLSPDNYKEVFKERLKELMSGSTLGLVQAMRPVLNQNSNLLILIDQFEEVFRFANEEEQEAKALYDQFVKLIIETVRQRDVPIYAILTLRSDFLGDCVSFEGLPEAINDGHYLVPRMNKAQMKRAITGPVDFAEGKISPRLVQHITLDLGDNPDQLPVLQHAMMRSWDYWKKEALAGQPLDLDHFAAIGDLDNALSNHADEAFAELKPEQQALAEKVFKCLTTKKTDNRGVRRPMSLANLMKTTQASKADILACLLPFRKAGCSFILPGLEVQADEQSIFDISHESLMRGWNRLKTWVDEEMESSEFYLRICTAAELHQSGSAALWRDPELQLAIDWKEEQKPILAWAEMYHPNFPQAISFIEESTKAAIADKAKKNSRKRLIRGAVTAFIIVISLLATWALMQTNVAEQKSAEAQQKSAEAIAQKKLAESSKDQALQASKEAQSSSERAKEQAAIAENQARIAEEQKKIAETEKGRAEEAANLALSKQQLADLKSKEALEQKQMADAASAEANRLRMLATSQNLAYSSAQLSQNPELSALLAIESYKIAKTNGGNTNSASLYKAALKSLQESKSTYSPKVLSLENEALALNASDNGLSLMDKKGNLNRYDAANFTLVNTENSGLATEAINTAYINPINEQAFIGSNSNELNLIDRTKPISFTGHGGLVRAVAYRSTKPYLISGGRDAQLILWEQNGTSEKVQFDARVKAISALPTAPTLLVGCENGVVYRFKLDDKSKSVFAAKESARVESIAQTEDGRTVAIGYSDGITRVYTSGGSLLKEFTGMGSVVSLEIKQDNDVLAIIYSGRLIRLYALSDLSKLPIEIKTERPITRLALKGNSSELFIYSSDRSIQRYPLKADWFINELQAEVSRELSPEEWKTFVGEDIPYSSRKAKAKASVL